MLALLITGRDELEKLVDHLSTGPFQAHDFGSWRVTPINGGANNLIYRATNEEMDVAIKFTLRDARNRAEREFLALTALQQLGLRLAPAPVWLEQERYAYPVVVQEWLTGEVMRAPPETDAAWEQLLNLYAAVHTLTPATVDLPTLPIRTGVFAAASPAEAKQLALKQAHLVPEYAWPDGFRGVLEALEATPVPDTKNDRVFCHVDANVSNFIKRSGELYAVDWEGSGWSDPAFELANLMTHPAYLNVPRSRWEWVSRTYARLSRNDAVAERVKVYYPHLVAFWVARFARTLYEVPQGLDQRMVERPSNWQEDTMRKYQHYLTLAQSLL